MAGGLILLIGAGYLLSKNSALIAGSTASTTQPVVLPHSVEAIALPTAPPDLPKPELSVASLPATDKILKVADAVRGKAATVKLPAAKKFTTAVSVQPAEVTSITERTENSMPTATGKRADKRDVTLALSQFNDAARQDVTSIMSQFNEAVRAGDFDAAKILRDKISAALGVNSLVTLRMHGFLALKMGELEQAKADYEKVLASLPNDYEANLNLAVIDTQQGNPSLSKKRSKQMLEIYPDDAVFKVLAN